MSTRPWPTSRLMEPQEFGWGITAVVAESRSPFTGSITTGSVPFSSRYRCTTGWAGTPNFAEQQQRIGFLMSCGREHRVSLWNMTHPVPAGTMRGTPTLFGSHLQGATSLAITTTTANTLVTGDILGVTTSAGLQLVTIAIGSLGEVTFTSVGGVLTVPIVAPLRAGATNGAAVTWDKPKSTFLLLNGDWIASFRPMSAEPLIAEWIEVW